MTSPQRYLVRMVIFVVAVLAVSLALFPALEGAFMTNPALNGLILGVLLAGIVYIFRQVLLLGPQVAWIEAYRRGGDSAVPVQSAPRLLAPVAQLLGERGSRSVSISALSMRSLLDGIAARLDESRDISRYMIGLLIFLGLLGTFWGLLRTIGSVSEVIDALTIGEGDLTQVFGDLKAGLKGPLAGMGTAFSSSLFGLAGSLVLGFLELQASQAQNRFFNDLEDWLSSMARLSGGAVAVEGEQSVPAYIQALLEQTADGLEGLQRALARSEDGRTAVNAALVALTEKLSALADQMRDEREMMARMAESQADLKPAIGRLADAAARSGIDEPTRAHIRNLDVTMSRLLDEVSAGQTHVVEEIRGEIRLLARTIAAIAEETEG